MELEMFFTGFPTISGLQHFPNLRKLVIMHQGITRIKGLESLILLEELWLCECKIKVSHCILRISFHNLSN